jgi:hypothetical protein
MIKENIRLSLNDISIVPCVTTDLESRSECNPYISIKPELSFLDTSTWVVDKYTDKSILYGSTSYNFLPLFTAPMSTVVGEKNMELFKKNNIIPILPRNICFEDRIKYLKKNCDWVAFGLKEVKKIIENKLLIDIHVPKILIDIANGHMKILFDLVQQMKEQNENTIVMIGNIANPNTYLECCKYDVDYVRLGVGGGSGCITASNTGIFYPTASLISEINYFRTIDQNSFSFPLKTKIVADGCARGYSDIIKALALGADYVMCGKLFAQMLETPGECLECYSDGGGYAIDQYNYDLDGSYDIVKEFYGMASRHGQKDFCTPRKTSEGKIMEIKIQYTMSQWVENFTDYLKSAMAYTGKRTLKEFIGGVDIIRLSENASNSYNK